MKRNSASGEKNRSKAFLLIFLAWLVYTTSYLGKVNYSANITQIIDFYGVSKSQAGTVPTFFFFSYGIGQVFNGLFCKKYNIKLIVFSSLAISGIINFIIAVTTEFSIIKWLWMINGFVLAVLWPTLIRLLSENLPQKDLGVSSVVMGTTVASGTLVIYGLSSVFAAFSKFKLSFYTAAFATIVVAFVWFLFYNKAVAYSNSGKTEEIKTVESKVDITKEKNKNAERKLFFVSVYALCFCAIGVNLIKDGLTTWVPSILKEEFSMSDSLSILLTLLLPVLAVFANAFALKVHKKIPDYINQCAAVFLAIAVFIAVIITSLKLELVWFMLGGLVITNFLASSLNSLITSIFPLFMRGKVNSGMFAGVLNGCCYVGSTLSAYGLGLIADKFDWLYVFITLLMFCGLAVIVWTGYFIYKYTVRNKNI